ncbi:OmpA family protein [Geobacter sp. DSM 9736]|uniref:OmpA family protein n=1 Tax=Geobacter sp. DSM 9736 TaxID=1277350 RepID=UPI000B502D4F|nr:OmpA family protein [Geobacter sp. DSM 9736]SNB46948.1 Outer membrane protein OmpA [Geobacter sp. DSM 9736]
MKKVMIGAALVATALAGCSQPLSNTKKGSLLGTGAGAATGALLGQVIGRDTESTLIGAGAGAVVGGISGALIGDYMDKQEEAMRRELGGADGVSISRDQNDLGVNFKGDLLFDVNSATVRGSAADELRKFAKVVNQYPQTMIYVAGHTDSTGTADVNQRLSERRAASVKQILVGQGVDSSRVSTAGYGELKPVGDNKTDGGRAKNRRVDITIKPVEKK